DEFFTSSPPGAFGMEEEPHAFSAPPQDEGFTVDDFELETTSSPAPAEPAAGGIVSAVREPETAAGVGHEPADEFSFDDDEEAFAPPAPPAKPAADDYDGFDFDEGPAASSAPAEVPQPTPDTSDDFSLDDFGGEDEFAPPAQEAAAVPRPEPESPPAYAAPAAVQDAASEAQEEEFQWASQVADPDLEGDQAAAMAAAEVAEEQAAAPRFSLDRLAADGGDEHEELPPLSITSRHKGGASGVAGKVLVVLAVAALGGGGYFLSKGDGLGSLGGLLGGGDAGTIEVRKVEGAFVANPAAGELFVVKGEVVNNRKKPAGPLQVKAKILGAGGGVITQKTGYCGNTLPPDQLASFPLPAIEMKLGGRPAQPVSAGGTAPCMVVFSGIPKDAVDFVAEVVPPDPSK
ncbi:MAG TPA: hypothetical protein VNX25_02865, partial [Verrucomicrobiae bacterium]|nr:hypothetical protein [Verrucomicrobiae bacterium]